MNKLVIYMREMEQKDKADHEEMVADKSSPILPSHEDPRLRHSNAPSSWMQGIRHGTLFAGLGYLLGYGLGIVTQKYHGHNRFSDIFLGTLTGAFSGLVGLFAGRMKALEAQGQFNYMRAQIDRAVDQNSKLIKALDAKHHEAAEYAMPLTSHNSLPASARYTGVEPQPDTQLLQAAMSEKMHKNAAAQHSSGPLQSA